MIKTRHKLTVILGPDEMDKTIVSVGKTIVKKAPNYFNGFS